MATYEYVIVGSNCDTTGMDHYHTEYLSTINNVAKANIPSNAVISSVQIYLDANFDNVFGTLGSPDVYFYFCPDDSSKYNSGTQLLKSTIGSSSTIKTADISSYVTKTYPFTINTSYPKLSVFYDSLTRRLYHCDSFKIIYTYSIPTYTLTVNAGTGGTVSGGGTYNNQATATLTATPSTGYKFVKWSDGNTSATRTVTVTANTTYTATFEKLKYTVTFKNYDGSVLETYEGIEYGNTPKYVGSTPTKPSTEQYDYTFSGWSPSIGAISGNTTYTAQFTSTVRKYTITGLGTNGTVTGGGTYEYGKSVTLTATPNDGYKFKQWSDGVTTATRTVTVTGAATYTAVFEELPPEIKSVQMIYLDKQISATNKVPCGEGFIISVELS